MNDLLTFFRNRQSDGGKEQRIRIELKDSLHFLLFYTKQLLDDGFYQEKLSTGNPAIYTAFKANLRESMRQSGGGLLVEENRSDGRLIVEISKVGEENVGGFEPPQTIFCIEYGGELRSYPFTNISLRLPLARDAHLIIPVDTEAEAHFRSFRENYSSWFPADFETNMLHILRRPSLDLRIERLERIISERAGLTENGTAAFNGDMQSPFTLTSWISLGFVVVLLVLSYAYPHLWLALTPTIAAHSHSETQQDSHSGQPLGQSSFSEQAADAKASTPLSSSNVETATAKALNENSDQSKKTAKSNSDLQNAIFALVTKLKSKSATDNRFKTILSPYFTQEDIVELNVENAAALSVERSFFWGIIKLQALLANAEAKSHLSTESWNKIANKFDELYSNKDISLTSDANITCWPQSPTNIDFQDDELKKNFEQVFNAKICVATAPEKALEQIKQLTARLDKIKQK